MSTAIESLNRLRTTAFSRTAILVILLSTAVGAVYGYVKARNIPFIWKISSKVMVHVGREGSSNRPEVAAVGGSPFFAMVPGSEDINAEIHVLRSPELMRRVYESLQAEEAGLESPVDDGEGPAETVEADSGGPLSVLMNSIRSITKPLDYQPNPEMARLAAFSGQFQFNAIPKTTMIEIVCMTADPERGKRQLQRLLNEYLLFHMETYSQGENTAFFEQQEQEMEQKHIEAQLAFREFRHKHDIQDFEATMTHLGGRRRELERELNTLHAQIATNAARLTHIEQQLKLEPDMTPATEQFARNMMQDHIERMLIDVEMDLLRAENRYHEGSPMVDDLARTREQLREQLKESEPTRKGSHSLSRNPIHTHLTQARMDAQTTLVALEEQKTHSENDLARVRAEILRLDELRLDHDRLRSDMAELKLDLQQIKKGVRIGKMNVLLDQARITNVSVVSPPSTPAAPQSKFGFSTRRFKVLSCAAMGLFLSLAFFLLRSALNETRYLRREAQDKGGIKGDGKSEPEAEATDLPEALSPTAPSSKRPKKK